MLLLPVGLRSGAVALATSGLLFTVLPLVRPFFPLDVLSPALAEVASGPLASSSWIAAHLALLVAFALLPLGLLAVAAAHAGDRAEARAWRAVAFAIVGIGLVMPAVGVETFAMPVIGRLHLEGGSGVTAALARIYRGPMTLVMLALLAVGAIALARGVWRGGRLGRWGGVALAAGLTLWVPLLPRPVRIVDGLLIGLGGVWLARDIWRCARHAMTIRGYPAWIDQSCSRHTRRAVSCDCRLCAWSGTYLLASAITESTADCAAASAASAGPLFDAQPVRSATTTATVRAITLVRITVIVVLLCVTECEASDQP